MENEELAIFSARLKLIRLELMLTQKEFADRIGLTASSLSAYENNVKNPSLLVAIKISKEFNVSIDWLCGISKKRTTNQDLNLTKYSDVIDILFKLSKSYFIDIEPRGKSVTSKDIDEVSIHIHDEIIQCYLKEWKELLKLRDNSTIDEHLYTLWIEDKKKEYDFDSELINGFLNEKARNFLLAKDNEKDMINRDPDI